MKTVRRSSVITLLVIGAIVGSSVLAAAAASTGSLAGNVEAELDVIAPGTVGVVASGAPTDGVVAVIVENRMPYAVTGLRIHATAVDGNGRAVARATTRRVVPDVLEPESLGLARVDFDDSALPAGTTYKFEVTSKRARGETNRVALQPTAFVLSPPKSGPVPQTLAVTLRNPTNARAVRPLRVAVMCFGESGRPVAVVTTTSSIEPLVPNASARTTVELPNLCPSYLVGATAHGP